MRRDITYKYDLSEALSALGIPHEVSVFDDRLGGEYGHMNPTRPHMIFVDTKAIREGIKRACPCPNCQGLNVQNTIAHELVHIAQAHHHGVDRMMHAKEAHDYTEDPFELQATELAPVVEKLIRRVR